MPSGQSLLRGVEVAITGRLASMTREAAVQHIETAGGAYVDMPGEKTALLVVGQDGWPLSSDGHLTRALRKARELQASGHAITIVSEEEFLASLGLQELQVGTRRLHTIEQLGRITQVPIARLRAWTRHGLLHPVKVVRRLCWFDFRQIANVRTLQRLQESGVGPQRVRRSLQQLGESLPSLAGQLSKLEPGTDERSVLVRLDDGRLADPGGQLQMDFGAAGEPQAPQAGPFRRPRESLRSPDEWFGLGVVAEEEERLEDAVECYLNALLAGGPQAETAFNLGNALFGLGRSAEAMQRYLQAVEIDPDYVEAWNNLGNAFAELGRLPDAERAYRQAIVIEPDYADAHCNLGGLLEERGRRDEAIPYWQRFLALDPDSSLAHEVRRRLGGDPPG